MNITEFQKSRFGLFIHWGIYSIPARGEWVRSNEEMKEEDYIPFANEFDQIYLIHTNGLNWQKKPV